MTEETNVTTTPMQPVSLPKNKPNDALSILALFGDLTDIGLDPCEELPRVPAPMTKPQAAEQEMIWSLDDIRREEMLFERALPALPEDIRYVSQAIGDVIQGWGVGRYVIDAGTGAGKTTAIIDLLTKNMISCPRFNVEDRKRILYTNNKNVWNYITRFAEFNRFTNSPVANYKGELYSLPFNMYTFNKMWGVVTPEEAAAKIEEQRKEITHKPRNLEEQAISLVGRDIYEKLIKGYPEKQWGRDCKDLPAFIIKRLPVRLTFDNNYFNALYQGIPIGGYTNLITNLLDGMEVRLNTDYLEHKSELDALADKVVYTGPIDAYFDYKLGTLEYRSVRFENELLDKPNFQGNAAVNYTDRETPWTRIIEHKWFEFGKDENGNDLPRTIISREYSSEWKPGDEPYYPVNDAKNSALYAEYKKLADAEPKVVFGGRLGEYKYYDMDTTIEAALRMSRNELYDGKEF